MRVLILNGSPKAERSNTLNITNAFVAGFLQGTDVCKIDLYKKNIKPCMGCFSCWSKTPGSCVIADDMIEISNEIKKADIIIMSFPLYFFGLPSEVKAFVDRCLPFMKPYMGNMANGSGSFHELRDESMEQKKLVLISTCGYVKARPMFPALLAEYDLICGKGNYTAILCPEGELFIAEKAKRQRDGYLEVVREAGAEFSENLKLSDETMEKLSQPILSPRGFEAITLAHWKQESKYGERL